MTGKGFVPESGARGTPWYGRIRKDLIVLVLLASAILALSLAFPSKGEKVARYSLNYLREIFSVLPAVLILMGLFTVWIKRETVAKYLGEGSGIKGLILAMALGSLPTGPLFIGFPLTAILLRKGMRVANAIAFLSAWACITIPQELVELQFLGWRFALTRFTLTAFLVGIMSLGAERLYNRMGIPMT